MKIIESIIHFLKTNLKNPKLDKNEYKFMIHVFIKGIARLIVQGLNFIFIDEAGFKFANNNYYDRNKKDEDIIGRVIKEVKIK